MFDTDEDFNIYDEFLDDVFQIESSHGQVKQNAKETSVKSGESNSAGIIKQENTPAENKIQKLLKQINESDFGRHMSEEPATHVKNKFQEKFLNSAILEGSKSSISPSTSSANVREILFERKFPVPNILVAKHSHEDPASVETRVPFVRDLPGPAGLLSKADTSSNPSANSENVSFHRKFPGPAGLLPFHTGTVTMRVHSATDDGSDSDSADQVPLCSQSINAVLESAAWKAMISDYDVKNSVLRSCTIAWVKGKALAQQLPNNKVPFLGVAIKSVDLTLENPYVVLQDETGSMPAVFHRDIREAVGAYLKPGSVVVLWNTGIISTRKIIRRHSLNVTMKNLISIFSNSEFSSNFSESEPTGTNRYCVKQLQNITKSQLIDNVLCSRKRKKIDSPALPFNDILVNDSTARFSAQSSQSSCNQTSNFESDSCIYKENTTFTSISTECNSPYSVNYDTRLPKQTASHTAKCTIPASGFHNTDSATKVNSTHNLIPLRPVTICNSEVNKNKELFKVSTCQNLQLEEKMENLDKCRTFQTHNVNEKTAKKLSAFQLKKPTFSNSTSSTVPAVTHSVTSPSVSTKCNKTTNFKNSVSDNKNDENHIANTLLDSIDFDLLFDDF